MHIREPKRQLVSDTNRSNFPCKISNGHTRGRDRRSGGLPGLASLFQPHIAVDRTIDAASVRALATVLTINVVPICAD